MDWKAWTTVGVIVGAMALFASERVRIDVVALITLVVLTVLGIVTPEEAVSGFSNEATVTVGAMFALSLGIERSGALIPLTRVLTRIRKPWLLTLALMLAIAPIGAFVKNIALVATFLPLALRVCARTGTSPGRVLMPMAFAAQMGGVCTLLGTSSNLLADSLAQKHGLAPFGVFEFTKLGVVLAAVGITYLMLVGRWLLPKRVQTESPDAIEVGKYVTELKVMPGSSLVGSTMADAKLGEQFSVYPLELVRDGAFLASPRSQTLVEGDVMLVRGSWDKLEDFRHRAGLEIDPEFRHDREGAGHVLAEIMIAPASRFEGQMLGLSDFERRYKLTPLAIHRRGQVLREKLKDAHLRTGDVLLVLADEAEVAELRADPSVIVLSEREDARRPTWRALVAIAIMVGVVAVSGLRLLPIPVAAITGAVAMVLTGCFGRHDIYQAIDWKVIILLGAILPLGIAIEKTGLSANVVHAGMQLVGQHAPVLALLMVYVLTALLTELMGHNPSVVLMVGIAASVATALGVDARPFVVAVAFAAATSFATPVGYPTNTMVYYAGGYRFTDFMRVGIPLIALFCAISMMLIPIFWPLTP